MSEDMVCIGAIAGAFGVTGEVRLKSFATEPRDVATYAPLQSEDGRLFDVELVREIKTGFAARLSGVASKEAADKLKGTRLYVPRERLPNLPDDEFYHADLMGLEVRDTGGATLGTVKAVLNHGGGDILEIIVPGQSRTALLPFTQAAVPNIDLAAGVIIADPPEGVFD